METLWPVLSWWFTLLLFSLAFYPLFKPVLANLVDKGWLVSKVLGLLILTFTSYLIGIFHLVKFSQLELWALLTLFFIISQFYFRFSLKEDKNDLVWVKKVFLLEFIFFFLFLGMAIIRGYQPQINGLEKYMDYAFIKSALTGDYFPPQDPWWSGGFVNYYYFGHLWVANLIKLTGVSSGVGFNLALALCFSLTASLIIEFVYSWTKKLWPALLGAFLHLGVGNLHLVTTFLSKVDWKNPTSSWLTFWNGYWYPDSSRLIYHVITEFPVYSFVVYDLHAHVLAFPQDLLIIGLIGEFFRSKKFGLPEGLIIGFLLGLAFLTNAWDLAVYYLLLGFMLALFVVFFTRSKKDFKKTARGLVATLVMTALVIWPFWHFFDRLSLPVLPTTTHSPIFQLLQLWGLWFFLGGSFLVFIIFKLRSRRREVADFDWFTLVLYLVGFLLVIIGEFVYVKDIYGADYQRANTVFKLTFQSWNIWAMGSGYLIWRLIGGRWTLKHSLVKGIWSFLLIILVGSCFLYTIRAYESGYGDFKNYSGLDGESFLGTTYSQDEVEALNWVKNNTSNKAVVLEASGDSYTNYQRVSVFTGRATVVGWGVHEWLWRGSFDPVGKRQADVQNIYTTMDPETFKSLVNKYHIDYIYLGNLEREKYLSTPGVGLIRGGSSVFRNNQVEIYKVNH